MPNIGSAPVSLNHQPGLIVQSSSGVRTDPMVELYADPTTHRLLVDAAITIDNLTVSENIAQVGGATITLGQKTMANSLPVTLASDQLPAGAALTDSLANPTTTVIGSMLMGYNSSSWERLRTDLGDGSVSTGLQNIVPMLYNGTTYDRLPGSTIGLQVKGGYTEVAFTTTTVQAVATTEVINYRGISIHIVSQGTGSTVNFQGSNDNTNWVPVRLHDLNTASVGTSTTAAGGIWHGTLAYRYFRLNVTGISALTTAGVIEFYTVPPANTQIQLASGSAISLGATSNNIGNVGSSTPTGSAVPANAFYIGAIQGGNLTGLASLQTNADGLSTNQPGLVVNGYNSYFNGASWDRARGNWNTTTGDTPTITTATTTNGATQTNYNARGAIITAILGTVTGTSPTLALQLQYSPDAGTTWLNFAAATAATAIATGNTVAIYIYDGIDTTTTLGATGSKVLNARLPRTWRVNYISTGSGTLSIPIASCQVNYLL